jgi:hypothetical protein
MASELESYKRPDHAVLAFNEMTLKLAAIGGGEIGHEICHLVRRKYEQISKIFVLLSNRSKSCPTGARERSNLRAVSTSPILSGRLLGAVLNKANEAVMRRFEGYSERTYRYYTNEKEPEEVASRLVFGANATVVRGLGRPTPLDLDRWLPMTLSCGTQPICAGVETLSHDSLSSHR